jgi:lysophospholipase L1-like esterase
MLRDFPWRTALTIAITGAVLAGTHAARHPEPPPPSAPPATAPPEPIAPTTIGPTQSPLFDDRALDSFYAALIHTERKESVTRIVHYGDSPITADLITCDVRALLQARFGDAGHGFLLADKPWAWYQHDRVKLSASGWKSSPASRFIAQDGFFGLGGVSSIGTVRSSTKITYQTPQTRFELWYERQPNGGTIALTADDVPLGTLQTTGDTTGPAFESFESPTPIHTLALHITAGTVRVFGISAARPGPGVVYDSLGLNGASITVMTRMFNQQHWTAELQHRDPHLVIVNYGANEADFPDFIEKQYEKELRTAIDRLHTALPQTAILIMSPMDRGHKTGNQITTMPTIPRIVGIQRRVARETGCGFFDTFQVMGGEGTMARWYTEQPRLVSADFIHPYPAGGKIIAEALVKEIEAGLARYRGTGDRSSSPVHPEATRLPSSVPRSAVR